MSQSSNSPIRNLAVTGTPYGEAFETAARRIAAEQLGPGRHRRATATAGDLGGRAAEVDVDVVDAAVVAQLVHRGRP